GMYEPVHGSAPDISGQDKANPLAMILSVGMMFRYSFELSEADEIIKQAVVKTLETYRTVDIMAEGKKLIGCREMGERVLQTLEQE
ncbi:MAG TPA: 3-isopropylmalate dehydrogenase, partial [Deltaproteobacteria bacterium]|nr:3-isopropylmalate dehydrogenase [Deltaproteobacteria bacterium]